MLKEWRPYAGQKARLVVMAVFKFMTQGSVRSSHIEYNPYFAISQQTVYPLFLTFSWKVRYIPKPTFPLLFVWTLCPFSLTADS